MQLPFAIFPRLAITSSKQRMGEFANQLWAACVGYLICTLIAALNVFLLWNVLGPLWVCLIAGSMIAFAAWAHFVYAPKHPTVSAEPKA